MKNNLKEIVLEEIRIAEEKGRVIKLLPIIDIYKTGDPRMYLNCIRDYIWFNEINKYEIKYIHQ